MMIKMINDDSDDFRLNYSSRSEVKFLNYAVLFAIFVMRLGIGLCERSQKKKTNIVIGACKPSDV